MLNAFNVVYMKLIGQVLLEPQLNLLYLIFKKEKQQFSRMTRKTGKLSE
jgi:hypothetical protein